MTWKSAIVGTAFGVAVAIASATASFASVTGAPSAPNPFGWLPNSTNLLNYDSLTPGREGQAAPFVELTDSGAGYIELTFSNLAPGLAFFEKRIDGVSTGSTAHPVVIGDTIHAGGIAVYSGTAAQAVDFLLPFGGTVEIRLALGGERDFDFDWTTFDVSPAAVPVPAALPLLLCALGLMGYAGRRTARS